MHTSLYILIIISVLAGFFMRPLNTFVLGKVVFLLKYTDSKPLVTLLFFAAIVATFGVTISTIYLSLKLSGFIPLSENTPTFVVSFFVGGVFWVIYARKFNKGCQMDI